MDLVVTRPLCGSREATGPSVGVGSALCVGRVLVGAVLVVISR